MNESPVAASVAAAAAAAAGATEAADSYMGIRRRVSATRVSHLSLPKADWLYHCSCSRCSLHVALLVIHHMIEQWESRNRGTTLLQADSAILLSAIFDT